MSQLLLMSAEEYFSDSLKEARVELKIQLDPLIEEYLVELLKHYVLSSNLFKPTVFLDQAEEPPKTFAEIYLKALNAESPKNREIMKVLADKSMYLAGFFKESLSNKINPYEYYSEIGMRAFESLSRWSKEESSIAVYASCAKHFTDYVSVLSFVSEKSTIAQSNDVVQLYERFLQTGSKVARDKLIALGYIDITKEPLKVYKA